jgi:REP element-mobilizing transposase RayT
LDIIGKGLDTNGGKTQQRRSCQLQSQKESKMLEGHLQADHVHMLVSILPKYSVAQVVGLIKGKGAIQIARNYLGGYFV